MSKENKRENMIQVAAQVFSRYGFEKTTIDDIGAALNLNKSSLYYYFKNKEEIFSEVVMNEAKLLIHDLHVKIGQVPGIDKKITYYMQKRWACYDKALNANEVTNAIRLQVAPVLRVLYKKVLAEEVNYLAALIGHGVEKKEFSPCSPKEVAELLITMSNAIKGEEFNSVSHAGKTSKQIYKQVESKTIFATQLVLKGLSLKSK